MTVRIKVTYPAQNINVIDSSLDGKIKDVMDRIGATWYAQGVEVKTKVRDICFDLEIEG